MSFDFLDPTRALVFLRFILTLVEIRTSFEANLLQSVPALETLISSSSSRLSLAAAANLTSRVQSVLEWSENKTIGLPDSRESS